MKPYIRGGILEHFADTVALLGAEARPLLAAADVALEVLTVPGVFLPYGNYMRLLHLAARQTGAEHFGLLMARASNAASLATTPGTLQARLENEQCSFRDILQSVRREIATFHLRRGDMQLTQLALVLGYSKLSAFSRSFRSWYGESPRDWSRRAQWQQAD
ncbi:helix-turn-helix domain-containing protein [Seongchinamella sediminis]|uniref:Helix-turn-helix domain-containing protein n=1 Tax=Seongchinamella sediminis TaxID=2283635 RepID=A0A3L7E2X3_9GAMM|nr:helix-turn-helix domain-containing protein [Seongchinamella sediminis]RLQ23150.1 helix-turn-helix domain-containing protein [Seongchinamella sediminis]